jgi:hypothetical protein
MVSNVAKVSVLTVVTKINMVEVERELVALGAKN